MTPTTISQIMLAWQHNGREFTAGIEGDGYPGGEKIKLYFCGIYIACITNNILLEVADDIAELDVIKELLKLTK